MTFDYSKIDPEIVQHIQRVQAVLSSAHKLPATEAREQLGDLRLTAEEQLPVHEVTELSIPATHGSIPCRIYKPNANTLLPAILWFHGGGWVFGDLDSADHTCRDLAVQSNCMVISVDYRLAPEHPYPAAFEDGCTALQWLMSHATEIGANPQKLAIGGDSAGGNLAACVCIASRDSIATESIALRYQLLVYPVVEACFTHPSYVSNADGYLLTRNMMEWFWNKYVPNTELRNDWQVAPLNATLAGLPPAWVLTAAYDPLRDEGIKYARALAEAGVEVSTKEFDDAVHGFFTMPVKKGAIARKLAGQRLHSAIGS